ncbi:IS3 family transposase [Psychrobacter sp. FDAARGOS_221]|uniref:IS3 family transposase n=1 Tax=Psychrobacter sp. FDAARGOS_221 TaxID=1975705 RepID=UPI000BB59207|nr:IS3 family transposase [Psychrobacter sp. FDAARGOS_221]PNK61333.1 hypothetical protein A6J60_010965 [Psychrobacter sp. FDAARGOS_221]
MSRTTYYYKPKLSDDSEIVDVLNKLTDKHNRWGFPKCLKCIRKLGYSWNHKRVHRVYTALNLNLHRKSKRRLPIRNPQPLSAPSVLGHTWFMDFMSDKLHDNIRFRTFNVIDDYNREVLGIDISTNMPSLRVIRYLD